VITGRFNGKAVSSLFYTWSTALSGGMLLFNTDLKGWRRWLMGLVLGLTLSVGIVQTRPMASNWMPPLITIGVLILLKWWRAGVLLGVVAIALAITRYDIIYNRLFGLEQYSAFTRAATFPIMLEMVKASPLLGLGPSNYYFYTPLFSLLGYYVQFNSHNNYWDLAAQVGLVGLGVFIWMAVMLAWMGWRLRRKAVNGFQHGYGNAMLAGFAGMLVSGMMADWFMPFVYNIGFDGFRAAAMAWMFLGGLIVLERLSIER
jgi:O-antigen ligase